jgi:hypothetical protein
MQTYLHHHILPYFKEIKLLKITPIMIENWIIELREKTSKTGDPLSPTIINHCLTVLKIMLKTAVHLGYIHTNPADGVGQLRETPKKNLY